MKKEIALLFLITISVNLFCFCSFNASKNQTDFSKIKGPYLGQTPPGKKAEIFAPGIISTGFNEQGVSFTEDGKELYFRILGPPHGAVFFLEEKDGRWTKPKIAPFLGNYDAKCSLSPDGNKIVFSTSKPKSKDGKPLDHWEIWITERSGDGWSEPVNIGLKSDYDVACPSITNSGNIYYYSESIPGGIGCGDIYMSVYENGNYSEPVNLGNPVNTEFWENDPYISPDESYLIFQSDREGDHEFGDLFISFKNNEGLWGDPVNMGDGVNSPFSGEGCPWVSPDGKYLFFSTLVKNYKKYTDEPLEYETKMKILSSPGNGSEDIYWVSAEIIDELKPDK